MAGKSCSRVVQSFEFGYPFAILEYINNKPMLCRIWLVIIKRYKWYNGKYLILWMVRAIRCSCGCVLTCMVSWDCFLVELSDVCGLCIATGALHLWH